jgi:hypothetical protein
MKNHLILYYNINANFIKMHLPFLFDREHHFSYRLGASLVNYTWDRDQRCYEFTFTFNTKQHFKVLSKMFYTSIPKRNLQKTLFCFWREHNYLLWPSLGLKVSKNNLNDYYITTAYDLIKMKWSFFERFSDIAQEVLYDSNYLNRRYYISQEESMDLDSFISFGSAIKDIFGGSLFQWTNPFFQSNIWISDIYGAQKEYPFSTKFYDSNKGIFLLKNYFKPFYLRKFYLNCIFFKLNKLFTPLSFSNQFLDCWVNKNLFNFIDCHFTKFFKRYKIWKIFIPFYTSKDKILLDKIIDKKNNKRYEKFGLKKQINLLYQTQTVTYLPFILFKGKSLSYTNDCSFLKFKTLDTIKFKRRKRTFKHKLYLHNFSWLLRPFIDSFSTIFLSLYKTNFLFAKQPLIFLRFHLVNVLRAYFLFTRKYVIRNMKITSIKNFRQININSWKYNNNKYNNNKRKW